MAIEWRKLHVYNRLDKSLAGGTGNGFMLDKKPGLQQVQTPSIAMDFPLTL